MTSPPLEREDLYSPSTRFTERGRRLETIIKLRLSGVVEPIMELIIFIGCFVSCVVVFLYNRAMYIYYCGSEWVVPAYLLTQV